MMRGVRIVTARRGRSAICRRVTAIDRRTVSCGPPRGPGRDVAGMSRSRCGRRSDAKAARTVFRVIFNLRAIVRFHLTWRIFI